MKSTRRYRSGRSRPEYYRCPSIESLELRTVLSVRVFSQSLEAPNLAVADAYLVDVQGHRMEPATVGTVAFVDVEVNEENLPAGTTYDITVSINGETGAGTFTAGDPNPHRVMLPEDKGWVIDAGLHTLDVTLEELPGEETSDNSLVKDFTPETFGSPFGFPLGPVPAPQSQWFVTYYVDLDPTDAHTDYRGEDAPPDHDGLDISINNYSVMDAGVPVLAIADGVVRATTDGTLDRNLGDGLPNGVTLDHGNGWLSVYGHMRFGSIAVQPGDIVTKGQLLGYVGSSGAGNPHLHFVIKRNYAANDPAIDLQKAVDEAIPVETYVDPDGYWTDPLPYRGEIRTVNGIGVSDESPYGYLDQHRERPPDRHTFLPGETVYFWHDSWRIIDAPGLEFRWFRNGIRYEGPNLSDMELGRQQLTVPETQSSEPENWEIQVWIDDVADELDVSELVPNAIARFVVTTDPSEGPPEAKLYQGTDIQNTAAYLANGRSTPIDFDAVEAGEAPGSRTFTIVNHGIAPFDFGLASLPAGFRLPSGTAEDLPKQIEPGGTYELRLEVDPNVPGTHHGDVVLSAFNEAGAVLYRFAVAHALLPGVDPGNVVAGLDYELVSGDYWHSIPNFELLNSTPGDIDNFLFYASFGSDRFAIRYTGYILIAEEGVYTFSVESDDGSKLWIDDTLLVTNDFRHSPVSRSGTLGLKQGYHAIKVEYFEADGGEVLEVKYGRHDEADPDSELVLNDVPDEVLFRPSGVGDGSPPTVSLPGLSTDINNPTPFNPETTTLIGTATDPESGIRPYEYHYRWTRYNGSEWEEIVESPRNAGSIRLGSLVEGSLYAIVVSAVNGAGLTKFSANAYFRVDTTSPRVAAMTPAEGSYLSVGPTEILVHFAEPMDNVFPLETGNLAFAGPGAGTAYAFMLPPFGPEWIDETTLRFPIAGVWGEGPVSVTLAPSDSGHYARDMAGNETGSLLVGSFTIDTIAPSLLDIVVSGTGWSEDFTTELATQGFGNGGFSILNSSGPLPWHDIDQVKLVLDEELLDTGGLSLFGSATPTHELTAAGSAPGTEPGSFIYTWQLASPLTVDKLLITLDGTARDLAGKHLAEAVSSFNVVPGDVDGNGGVNFGDYLQTRAKAGTSAGMPGYDVRFDLDGDGEITDADATLARASVGGVLPDGEPVPPTADYQHETADSTEGSQLSDGRDTRADAKLVPNVQTMSIVARDKHHGSPTVAVESPAERLMDSRRGAVEARALEARDAVFAALALSAERRAVARASEASRPVPLPEASSRHVRLARDIGPAARANVDDQSLIGKRVADDAVQSGDEVVDDLAELLLRTQWPASRPLRALQYSSFA